MEDNYIVLYVNCIAGRFVPYGPYTKEEAEKIASRNNELYTLRLFEVLELQSWFSRGAEDDS